MNEKRWDESLALSKRLLELDPLGCWNVHLGEHYRAKGDRALALEHFRRAVDLDRDNAGRALAAGQGAARGRPASSEAVPELEAAHRLDPESLRLPQHARRRRTRRPGAPADAARLRAEAGGSKP